MLIVRGVVSDKQVSTFDSSSASAELSTSAASLQPERSCVLTAVNLCDLGEHVRPQQGSAAEGLDGDGRDSSSLVEPSGAQATSAGAHGRGHEQDQQTAGTGRGVRVPDVVQKTSECHEQEEGGPSRVRREGAGPHQRGQVHGGAWSWRPCRRSWRLRNQMAGTHWVSGGTARIRTSRPSTAIPDTAGGFCRPVERKPKRATLVSSGLPAGWR